MKHFVFITLFAITPIALFAQQSKFDIGVGGGLNMTSLHGEDLKRYFDWQYSYTGGVQLKYSFTQALSLVGNISYESKGSKGKNLKLIDEEGKSLGSTYNFKFTYEYITIPLLFRYQTINTPFFVNAGPYMGYLLKYTESYKDIEVDRTKDMQQFDLGVSLGVGLSYPVSDRWSISFELRNNLGLTNVRAGDDAYQNAPVRPALNLSDIRTNSTNFFLMVNYAL